MTKIFLSLILLLTATSVLALDCQYKVEEEVTVPRFDFYENGTKVDYALLIIDDFHRHNIVPMGELIAIHSFRVTNNYNDKINVTVTFNSPGPDSETLLIDAKSFARIKRPDTIPWSIDESSIVLYIHNEGLEAKKGSEVILQEVCKKCPPPNDFICLNDGVQSDSDEHCGSERRNVLGVCTKDKRWICGDGNCSKEVGENCKECDKDCPVASNHICNDKGEEVDDCKNSLEGMICCPFDIPPFKVIGSNQKCENGRIIDDCSNPLPGMKCCQEVFKKEKETPRDFSCKCTFECKEGVCFEEKCQEIFDPEIRCPSGTNVKEGTSFLCNIYGSNTKLSQDIKVTFTLEAGSGLSFSSTQGCHNVKGNQCIGNYNVADLSNEGINVELNAVAAGDSKVEGTVVFEYQGKKVEKKANPVTINVVKPKDGSEGSGNSGKYIWPEWLLKLIIAIIALIVIVFCVEKLLRGATIRKERKPQRDVGKELDIEDEELNAKYIRALKARHANMEINENGYPVFANNPKNLIHRYEYQHQYEKKYHKQFDRANHVHHIDNNKLNSLNFWNLIDITEAQHHRIIHGKINRGDWEHGLKVMMDALGWKEANLPDHIKEHMEKHNL